MDKIKIYLKDSDKARLANRRLRIVRETNPREPCDNEDLVFEKAEDESLIPANALLKWKFDCNHEHKPIWFFTTAERCKEMVSEDPSYWTKKKLEEFARIERRLYQDWWDGYVYGVIVEGWNTPQRKWVHINSCYGAYGSDSLIELLKDYIEEDMVVCLDSEDMKYEFDNTEKRVNEFND